MAFLIALVYAIDSISAVSNSAAPVALIVQDVLGGFVQKIFLIFVCVSIFACGMVIMVTNGRLIWSISRDRRLPGYQLWRQVPRATGGPTWATILAAVLGAAITLVLRTHTSALVTLFTASTIMPALLYASTVLMYIFTARRHRANQGVTVLAWDRRSRRALTPAIVWQDRRSSGICRRLSGSADRLAAITGLPLDPYFAAPKMTLAAREPDHRRRGHHDRHLAARPARRGVRDRRDDRVAHAAARPGDRGLVRGGVRRVRPRPGRPARGR
jgi:hypothetical protein